MTFFILWFAFSVLAGVVAGNKGRSGFGFFLLAVVLSPLIGLIAALVARPGERIEMDLARSGRSEEYKKCPMCAEVVRREAVKCRYCGADLSTPAVPVGRPAYTPTSVEPVLSDIARGMGKAAGAMARKARAVDTEKELTLAEILARDAKNAPPKA